MIADCRLAIANWTPEPSDQIENRHLEIGNVLLTRQFPFLALR